MAMTEADKKSNLLEKILEFNSKAISRDNEKKIMKKIKYF